MVLQGERMSGGQRLWLMGAMDPRPRMLTALDRENVHAKTRSDDAGRFHFPDVENGT
ncbi:MAG: hypothetical protein ACI9K5_003603 [Gammaproteobacteria bacterium]|jgi:hypothetical protein